MPIGFGDILSILAQCVGRLTIQPPLEVRVGPISMARGSKRKRPRESRNSCLLTSSDGVLGHVSKVRRGLSEQLVKGSKRRVQQRSGRRCTSASNPNTNPKSGRIKYSGYCSQPGILEHVEPGELSAVEFWKAFVSARRPVVISGHPSDEDWKATTKWTNEYLTEKAGHESVKVEMRSDDSDAFGRDRKKVMTFASFVKLTAAGDSSLYMTTQAVGAAEDKFPKLHAQPVTALAGDFPDRPSLLGHLVPQSVNLWMGCSPSGSSSGLHHDFHDNLYVLLRGQKRFRLYSPDNANQMALHGQLKEVHANGRIVYKDDGDIRADGASEADAIAWERQRAAGSRLEAAAEGNNSDAEDDLEAALDSMLDQALENGDEDLGLVDDYESDEYGTADTSAPSAEEPPSFSKVDLRQSDDDIMQQFPGFPGKASALVAEVKAGEMLYLPAGWFHEVTSIGGQEGGGHMALNYWMHPPDNLDPGPAGFASPYRHTLWPSLYQQRQAGKQKARGQGKTGGPVEFTTTSRDQQLGAPLARSEKSKQGKKPVRKIKIQKGKPKGSETLPSKMQQKCVEMPMWGSWFGSGMSDQQELGFSEEDKLLDALGSR